MSAPKNAGRNPRPNGIEDCKITGYYVPLEEECRGVKTEIIVEDIQLSFSEEFLRQTKTEGWGRTREGWFIGHYGDKWVRSEFPRAGGNRPLRVGDVAVDPNLIPLGSIVRLLDAPAPWNEQIFIADDTGSAIKGSHIDVYCGLGLHALKETHRVTRESSRVSWVPPSISPVLFTTYAGNRSDSLLLPTLLAWARNPTVLATAKRFAGTLVDGAPEDSGLTCATTLSVLLDVAGINVGVTEGAIALANKLEAERGWTRINKTDTVYDGDIGVLGEHDPKTHHIFLVVDASNQDQPVVADNQGEGAHPRPKAGGQMPNVGYASPVEYFLRAS